jgi:hypothetical protein
MATDEYYITGENEWTSFGENGWASLAERPWTSITRKMTDESRRQKSFPSPHSPQAEMCHNLWQCPLPIGA